MEMNCKAAVSSLYLIATLI